MFSHDLANLGDGKQDPGFVICHHHGNNSGVASQRLPQIIQVEFAVFIDFEPRHLATDLGEMLAEISYRLVLDARGDDVPSRGVLFQKTADGPIIRLGTAGRENDLGRVRRAEQGGHLLASAFHGCLHLPAQRMGGRGVAVVLSQVGLHRLKNFRGDACGGVVIEIDHLICK